VVYEGFAPSSLIPVRALGELHQVPEEASEIERLEAP